MFYNIRGKMSKKIKISVIILAVLLVLALGYIGYDKYSIWKQANQLGVFQQGAQYGYEQAITQIYQLSAPPNCQQVPIFFNNQTINVFAVECLPE